MGSDSSISTTFLRLVIIPVALIFLAKYYRVFPSSNWSYLGQVVAAEMFFAWCLVVLAFFERAKSNDSTELLKDNYSSPLLFAGMVTFHRLLDLASALLGILRKPLSISILALPAIAMVKMELVKGYLDDYSRYFGWFTALSVLSFFLLTSWEDFLFDLSERAWKNVRAKTNSFINWVYKTDLPSDEDLNVEIFPRDLVPSVIFYATHFLKVGSYYVFRFLINLFTRLKIRRLFIIFVPLVAVVETVYCLLVSLILVVYLGLSLSLRIFLRGLYLASFLGALAFNAYNLIQSIKHRNASSFLGGLGITMLSFLILETIRQLNQELPLFNAAKPVKHKTLDHRPSWRRRLDEK